MSTNSEYILSLFNIYLELEKGTYGIYNTLHDSAISISRDNLLKLRKNSLSDKNLLQTLHENKIIHNNKFNEKDYFKYYINKLKYAPVYASFVLMVTSSCNMNCQYCFEGTNKPELNMSKRTAKSAVEYIIKSSRTNTSIQDIFISFFGGEPLLNRKIIESVCHQIRGSELKDTAHFSITTNLTLLNNNDIQSMSQAMNLTKTETGYIDKLGVGDAIVKVKSRFTQPLHVHFPLYKINHNSSVGIP